MTYRIRKSFHNSDYEINYIVDIFDLDHRTCFTHYEYQDYYSHELLDNAEIVQYI